jgi:two-component system cell cycle response regulator
MTAATIDGRETGDVVLDGRRVCIVDDDELYRARIALMLGQKNLRTLEAADTNELQAVLDRQMPDCILLDYNLVSENGLFAVERLRQRYASLAPIVMVSADETQRTAVRAFRAGVTDYVAKRHMNMEELTSAVRRAIGLRIREEAREQELLRMRRNTAFDELTGLLTRAGLEERLRQIDAAARSQRRCYGLVALRVTRIDEVLDRFGVVATDRTLRAFGTRLRDLVRATDLCGTWTRGTFLYVVDAFTSPLSFKAVVTRLAAQTGFRIDLAAAHLDMKVVVAGALHPDDGASLEELLAGLEARLDAETRSFIESATGAADWVLLPGTPSEGPAEAPTERRRERRMRTLKQGRIYLDGLQSTIDCTVRNLSSGGAGLRLPAPTAIPEYFRLRISESGPLRHVRKCWHLNNDLGVEFLPGRPE